MVESYLMTVALLFSGMSGLDVPKAENRYLDVKLDGIDKSGSTLTINTRLEPLENLKISPKGEYAFTHVSAGYGMRKDQDFLGLKFQVFAQDVATIERLAHPANRLLLRLWDFNVNRLRLDHRRDIPFVDVYLTNEGQAGGEHLMGVDPGEVDSNGTPRRANMIYIYKLATFKDPVEQCRELAHEYGHASIPAIGGFSGPENWANGDVGERIYLSWISAELKAGALKPEDAMGVAPGGLENYLNSKVTPMIKRIGQNGPNAALLAQTDAKAFDEYVATAVYCEAILPRVSFARSLALQNGTKATDYFKAVSDAISEREQWEPRIPEALNGFPIWIPLVKGTIKGAKILEKKGDWAKVQPSSQTVIITNPPIDNNQSKAKS